jgi:deoxyribodipyrimidine photo-lyase
MKKKSIHLFRRDLRVEDNTALISAMENSDEVIPVFIFEIRQLNDNPYRSDNLVQFMLDSLSDLYDEIHLAGGMLNFFYGNSEKIIQEIFDKEDIDSLYLNLDYTPFSMARDDKIKEICAMNKVNFRPLHDSLINPPHRIFKDDFKPYTVFTPFLRKSKKIEVIGPKKNSFSNYYRGKIKNSQGKEIFPKILEKNNGAIALRGGRREALKILEKISKFNNYESERNFPYIEGTTRLSAHNKFGTVSIREVYSKIASELGEESILINELYWRDFFTHVAFHFPHVFSGPFKEKYSSIKWSNDKSKLSAWKNGLTGFPIVDAGMRELNSTGFMHNRVRMIVASFLVKDLHIDWREGERYFATKLIDYDPCVNNGNWQWAASTGCDAQPYFRIFNPWTQGEKFDHDCIYIKRWVPELLKLEPRQIHSLWKYKSNDLDYPSPIVDHSKESKIAIEIFKSV